MNYTLKQIQTRYSLAILEPVNSREGRASDTALQGDVVVKNNWDLIWEAGTCYAGRNLNKDILS